MLRVYVSVGRELLEINISIVWIFLEYRDKPDLPCAEGICLFGRDLLEIDGSLVWIFLE